MDLVSIIVPVYNKEKYLRESIQSILNQSYEKIEIILIDDGSTDRSGDICDDYGIKDERVVVSHFANAGVSVARNRGIEMATGKYIMFFDADDFAENTWVEVLLKKIKVSNSIMAICGIVKEDVSGKIIGKHIFEKDTVVSVSRFLKLLNKESLSALWDKIYDADVIRRSQVKFDVETSIWEDLIFNLDFIMAVDEQNANVICCEDILYHYISVPTGLSKKYIPWKNASKTILNKIQILKEKYQLSEDSVSFYNKRCCDWCFSEIIHLTRSKTAKDITFINRLKQLKILMSSEEYKIMLESNEFNKYASGRYRKIVKSRNIVAIILYNRLVALKQGHKL